MYFNNESFLHDVRKFHMNFQGCKKRNQSVELGYYSFLFCVNFYQKGGVYVIPQNGRQFPYLKKVVVMLLVEYVTRI